MIRRIYELIAAADATQTEQDQRLVWTVGDWEITVAVVDNDRQNYARFNASYEP